MKIPKKGKSELDKYIDKVIDNTSDDKIAKIVDDILKEPLNKRKKPLKYDK